MATRSSQSPYYLLAESYGQLGDFDSAVRNVLSARPPRLWSLYLRQLREFFEAHERPPFLGERLQQMFAANSEAIRRITSYETEEQAAANLDALLPYLTAEDIDLAFVLERVECHFAERPASDEQAA